MCKLFLVRVDASKLIRHQFFNPFMAAVTPGTCHHILLHLDSNARHLKKYREQCQLQNLQVEHFRMDYQHARYKWNSALALSTYTHEVVFQWTSLLRLLSESIVIDQTAFESELSGEQRSYFVSQDVPDRSCRCHIDVIRKLSRRYNFAWLY